MGIQWHPGTYLVSAIFLIIVTITINVPNSSSFLFRRKDLHYVVNDPFQVRQDNITLSNLFGWLNKKNHIKFKLWTRKNPKLAHEIRVGDLDSLRTSNFDPRRLTKVIVHGYAHSANEVYLEDWIVSLRDAYLHLADLNILIIDYTLFALPKLYKTSAPQLAANRLTDMIRFLEESGNLTLEGLHMLGFSWGAHIAGISGWQLGGRVGRITGLDPAQPTFRFVDNPQRLDKSDALFVDIVHTNGGRSFAEGHLGLGVPLGHVDYYPNSGRAQPGCPLQWTHIYVEIECDHSRSVDFFAESIVSPRGFPSCRCDNWDRYVKGECPCGPEDMVFMGEHAPHSTRGKHYLFTRATKPYGLGTSLKLQLPDIDKYDPDWNNTGYHQHLLPYVQRRPEHHSAPHNPYPSVNSNVLKFYTGQDKKGFTHQLIKVNESQQGQPNKWLWKDQGQSGDFAKSEPVHESTYVEEVPIGNRDFSSDTDGVNYGDGYSANDYIYHGRSNLDKGQSGGSIWRGSRSSSIRGDNDSKSSINMNVMPNDSNMNSFTEKLFRKYFNESSRTSTINIVLS